MESTSDPNSRRSTLSSGVIEQTIGSYAIKETLGKGSFGKVKLGRHIHTNELVAIKILNRQKLKSANMDKKIHREIEILQLFSHPNICRLYEVISTPTDMYLIMEYVEGGELYDYIVQKGRVVESEARYIFQQIVCAIEYCHHYRVVHRDLKPENILIGPGLQVKLIDFGLSNVMKDGNFLATSCGSPNYAAPEVISGKLYFGPEVDVWSCGVILYALLCGCLPFDEDSIPVLFSKIKKGKYSIPSSLNSGPRELIQQLLVVDPLTRLTVAQIRDNAWFNRRLPPRLAYNASIFAAQEDRIFAVLVSETARRLNIRDKDVRRSLDKGAGEPYVAYNILLDAKRRKEITNEFQHLRSQDIDPSIVFQPRATERELNLGLMLTQSPAMEALLDYADATTNKRMYNTNSFVPASAVSLEGGGRSSEEAVGSFRMTKLNKGSVGTGGHSLSSNSHAENVMLRGTKTPPTRASMSTDQTRVGSVAPKRLTYSVEEERFILDHNCGWRVGLMTDMQAERVLMSMYTILTDYNMEWKVLSPFRLRVRTTPASWATLGLAQASPLASPSSADGTSLEGSATAQTRSSQSLRVSPPGSEVMFTLFVFRIHERHDKGFLIDFTLEKNIMQGLDVVLRLSEQIINTVG